MDKLGLQLLQLRHILLPFGEVANETREAAPPHTRHLTDGKMHREGRAILPLPRHHTAKTDDPTLARSLITLQIAVVPALIGLRHQHTDIDADDLLRTPAEQPLGGLTERLDRSEFVDDDHRVGHGF